MAKKLISERGTAQIAGAFNRVVDPGAGSVYFTRADGPILHYRSDTESDKQERRYLMDKPPLVALC